MSRKPQCPVTCHGGAIRPRRAGAPSCETRHLRSARSVLAKQVDYQTSFLLSSADGSRELSRAPPRCGMALASLSSHHRLCSRCGRINLPIVLIGATRPPLWAADNWTIAGGRLSAYRSRASPRRKLPAFTNFARPSLWRARSSCKAICIARLPRRTRSTTNDPQCPSPTQRSFCESTTADKGMRNDKGFRGVMALTRMWAGPGCLLRRGNRGRVAIRDRFQAAFRGSPRLDRGATEARGRSVIVAESMLGGLHHIYEVAA